MRFWLIAVLQSRSSTVVCKFDTHNDLSTQAKSKAPCIVFIDEIDAVGRQRGAGMGGGNDEREQARRHILRLILILSTKPCLSGCFGPAVPADCAPHV